MPGESSGGSEESATTPKDQAQLVKEAVSRHPQALIVEPANPADPDLARAIQDALAAKVPVVVLGRPLSGQAGSSSATAPVVVAPEPFAPSAKLLVAAAIRNARNAKLIPEAGAILLINTAGDAFLPDRISAIRDALKAAGITAISELRFTKDSQVLQKFLIEKLKADPKPTLVFSADFMSATASNGAVGELAQDRPFIQAGYTSDDSLLKMARMGEFAALGYYVQARLVRKAVSTAVALALKRDIPNRLIELPVIVHESPITAAAPQFQARYKSQMKEKSGGMKAQMQAQMEAEIKDQARMREQAAKKSGE